MRSLLTLCLALCLSSCVSLRIGPDEDFLRMRGLVRVNGTLNGLDDWDGHTWLDFGLFTNTDGRAEITSLELGPLAAVGVGLIGARVRLLGLEIGIGTLFYDPARRPRPEGDGDQIQLDEDEGEGPEDVESEPSRPRDDKKGA